MFLDGRWKVIPFYDITEIKKSSVLGPAMLISSTVTVLVKENWRAVITGNCIYLNRVDKLKLEFKK